VNEPIVTIEDVRKAGHCVRGCRAWGEQHGFDFRAFLKNGLPESVVLATGDEMALDIVQRKQERERGIRR
jgi:hypothetical protein